MSDASSFAGRFAAAVGQRSAPVTLRRVARPSGAPGLPNPPTLSAPVLDGAVSAGASTLAVRAADAVGRLVAGDTLVLGGAGYVLAADVAARSPGPPGTSQIGFVPGFDAIALTTPLLANAADGAAISFTWGGDTIIAAIISSYPVTMVNGSTVLASDLRVMVAAFGLTRPDPMTTRLIVPDGSASPPERAIVGVSPVFIRGEIMRYDIQAR